jgi:hypothetical protein
VQRIFYLLIAVSFLLQSCSDDDATTPVINEDPSTFAITDELELTGGEGAAEITAYDPATKQLFVVNNAGTSTIDVVDLSNPAEIEYVQSINVSSYGGGVNSVAVKNGLLAAAIEGSVKTDDGKIVIFNTSDLSEEAVITVGSLPDMVTFTPDGNFILSANEGEPSDDYTVDPKGSVSIITVSNFSVVTLTFDAFNGSEAALEANGYRVFGPNADLADDTEPEYIAISEDSKTAWVSLQENNGLAKVDIVSKTITDIFPLGFKDYSLAGNYIDVSDQDDVVAFATSWPVYGIYQPDGVATYNQGGVDYVVTANEGDAREYETFNELERINGITLDAIVFPNAAQLQANDQLGRLRITNTLGDVDLDGDFEKLYSFGARSFSIWNGNTGALVYDSKNELEKFVHENSDLYDDSRSDDKGVEPEGVTIARMGGKVIAFVGMERAQSVAVVDITNPTSPDFLQLLQTGVQPEGVLIISPTESPNGKSLLVVSSEFDGVIKVYQPEIAE